MEVCKSSGSISHVYNLNNFNMRTFDNWLNGKGIDLSNFEPTPFMEVVAARTINTELRQHNHVFKVKRDIDSGWLTIYERVNRLIFEKL